jgi:hypothetical protein
MLKIKSDEDNSTTTHETGVPKLKTGTHSIQHQQNALLNRLLTRPPYVSLLNSWKISGDYGHSSAIFKRPILEGSYFLEVMVKEDCPRQRKITNKSGVRVGICHHGYNSAFPIGCVESIAYKSADGSFMRNG